MNDGSAGRNTAIRKSYADERGKCSHERTLSIREIHSNG